MLFFELFWLRAGTESERWREKVKIWIGTASKFK
jgi:hypothetical protein